MIPFAFHTVIRDRASAVLDAGNAPVKTWGTQNLSISGCNVQPMSANEIQDAGFDQSMNWQKLHAPPGSDITTIDRVIFDGITYEVEGPPQNWPDPFTGAVNHLYVILKATRG